MIMRYACELTHRSVEFWSRHAKMIHPHSSLVYDNECDKNGNDSAEHHPHSNRQRLHNGSLVGRVLSF